MNLVSPAAELIYEKNPLVLVERVGRTCYKSEDKITEDSAVKFVEKLANSKHYAMLEHARQHFTITGIDTLPDDLTHIPFVIYTKKMIDNHVIHLLTLSLSHLYQYANGNDYSLEPFSRRFMEGMWNCFFTRWLDTVAPNDSVTVVEDFGITICLHDDLRSVRGIQEPDVAKHEAVSILFRCDRGVTHEFVRHRVSVGQESTRYCSYDKGKFGNAVTFIPPTGFDEWDAESVEVFNRACQQSEENYMALRDLGKTPQQARAVLLTATKADIILTCTVNQWKHFFDMRYFGTTGAPHPDAKFVAAIGYEAFSKWWEEYTWVD